MYKDKDKVMSTQRWDGGGAVKYSYFQIQNEAEAGHH